MPNKIKKFIICEKCNGNGFFDYELKNNVIQFDGKDAKPSRIVKVRERCTVCQGTGHTGSYLIDEDDENATS